jgi:hypothetical protein
MPARRRKSRRASDLTAAVRCTAAQQWAAVLLGGTGRRLQFVDRTLQFADKAWGNEMTSLFAAAAAAHFLWSAA